MDIIGSLMRRISPKSIEGLYYSPIGRILVKIYDRSQSSERKVFPILGGMALMSLSPRGYGERAIIYDAFEPEITEHFLSVVKEGDVVYDVGSWIGYYAILAAARKAGEVIAIEINSDNVERIKENARINHFDIKVLQVAASDQKGVVGVDTSRSSIMNRIDSDGDQVIGTDAIDNIAQKIDVLVMDIEGYEVYALKGLRQLLMRKAVSHLIIEVHPHLIRAPHTDADVLSLLEECGYSFQKIARSGRTVYHLLVVPSVQSRHTYVSTS